MAESATLTFPPPRNPDDLGRGPMIMGIVWMLTVFCVCMISARFYVRIVIIRALGSDDWLMLIAGILQIVSSACLTKAYTWGLGKHDADLMYVPQAINIFKWGWISAVPGTVGTIIARISIAVLLVRLFGSKKWLKWFLVVYTVLQTVVAIVFLIILFSSARPVEGLWNSLMLAQRLDPRIKLYAAIVAQSLLTFSDLAYVLFPVSVIWKLHMPLRQKVGLVALMAMSLVTMTASILKTVLSNIIPKITAEAPAGLMPDVQYVSSLSIFAGNVEQCLVIIMGCVAPLSPLTKLKFVASLYTSFNKVMSRLSFGSGKARTTQSEFSKPHSSYHNLDLMDSSRLGRLHQNDDEQMLKPPASYKVTTDNGHSRETSTAILRTDQFNVTYSERRHVREIV
ncbi:hypothetical protein DL769_008935 [Monosporascus sp. CRB-8-3]|nr:hypothetical protein DL769_008935 [Monosporascus sp. CRB-8-3]